MAQIPATPSSPKVQANFTRNRNLTADEIRRIISQRKAGQIVGNIAQGINLDTALVVRILKGQVYQELSAPIFAGLVFPGQL